MLRSTPDYLQQRDSSAPSTVSASALPGGMTTASSVPIELEKPASTCHQLPPLSAVDLLYVLRLQRGSSKQDKQLHDYSETTAAQERRLVYIIDTDEPNNNKDASRLPYREQTRVNILSKLALERERSQRTTTPIIFVTEGLGGKILSQALHLASRSSTEKMDANESILMSTYGIIFLPTPRRRHLLHTLFLAAGQFLCYVVFYNYERRPAPWSTDPPILAPSLRLLQNPSTPLFVCAAFTYGILATVQYYINSTDRLQRHFVLTGLLIGAYTIVPSLANPNQRPALAFPLSISIIIAMALSTCAHWLWRTFFSTRKARLDRKIVEWVQEASEMDARSHVIRFHEIV